MGIQIDNSHCGKQYGDSLKKKKIGIKLPYDPAIPLLGIYPEETIIERDTHTPMFIAALFTIARLWKGFPGGPVVKNPAADAGDTGDTVQSLGWEDPLEKETATYSSILAWEIPWTEEPAGLLSLGLQRVRHD